MVGELFSMIMGGALLGGVVGFVLCTIILFSFLKISGSVNEEGSIFIAMTISVLIVFSYYSFSFYNFTAAAGTEDERVILSSLLAIPFYLSHIVFLVVAFFGARLSAAWLSNLTR